MTFIDTLDLKRFISVMDEQAYPTFSTSAEKDEITANKSFYIYTAEGEIRPADGAHNQFLQSFTLSFFTRESADIDVLALSNQLRKARLRFTGSQVEDGKFLDTDETARMTTLNFEHVIKACD